MNCDICFESFDHSIHKPYSLSSCPHTYCLNCLEKLKTKKCPQCNKLIKGKNANMALLKLIPESNYDKLKDESLKSFINLNEIKQDLKDKREKKLNHHKIKLALIKKIINDETLKLIDILKQKEQNLINECDKMFIQLNSNLDSSNYENNILFQINVSLKGQIEKNNLNQNELKDLNLKIFEIKQQLIQLLDQMNNNEDNYKFISNKFSNKLLLIGKIEKV
jgi:hypothetical protein